MYGVYREYSPLLSILQFNERYVMIKLINDVKNKENKHNTIRAQMQIGAKMIILRAPCGIRDEDKDLPSLPLTSTGIKIFFLIH